jgi:hypothetical protein
MAVDFPVSEYAYDSAGKTIPESLAILIPCYQ